MTSVSRKQPAPWAGLIPASDEIIYQKAGFGRKGGLGSRPGIMIIDVQYRTVGRVRRPIEEAVELDYPTACGEVGWQAVEQIERLLKVARPLGVPVFYAYVAPKEDFDLGRLSAKVPTMWEIDAQGYEFVKEVAPQPGDVLVPKRHPSAFFGTPMVSYLIEKDVDTLLMVGCTTSGCIRSSAADAFSYNFRVGVVEECVYDRSPTSHKVNLFDIDSKYGDLVNLEDAISYLQSVMQPGRRGDNA